MVLVLNGWAASVHAWDLCHFARRPGVEIFSYLDQLDGAAERALVREEGGAVIVGWSMGGAMALKLFIRHPEKIRALVLLAATARMMEEKSEAWSGMSERRLKAFEMGLKLTRGEGFFGVDEKLPNPYMADTDENLGRGLAFLRQTDVRRELLALKSDFPVRIFQSEHDGIVRPENAAFLKRVFPQAIVDMVAGSEHALPIFIPGKIDAAVEAFMANTTL